jgi:hypothetical protein
MLTISEEGVAVQYDDQVFPLGALFDAGNGNFFQFIRAGAAIAQYDALELDEAEGPNDFHPTSAVNQPVHGIAQVALADNKFGFMQVRGVATVKVAAGFAAGLVATTTAVAGTLDDVAPAADATVAAFAAGVRPFSITAISGGTATVRIGT